MAIVETQEGKVEGCTEDGLYIFRGVPYAEPPVGPLRWRKPQPIQKKRPFTWDASVFRARPWQPELLAASVPPFSYLVDQSVQPCEEDCLYLNIYTNDLSKSDMPVMIWFHGGGFAYGSGSEQVYYGGHLARKGVVLVTVNYRLGALGFMNLNEITNGQIPASGNEGLFDQLMAIDWVKENVGRFGGSPDNITVFGESAGAISIGALLALENSRGLFQRAILQSGSALTAAPLSDCVNVAEGFVRHLGSRDPQFLMNTDPVQLMEITDLVSMEQGRMIFQPCIDGEVLPTLPITLIEQGAADGFDVLAGTTKDESRLITHAFQADETAGLAAQTPQPLELLNATFPDANFDQIYTEYRVLLENSVEQADDLSVYAAIETERSFRIPSIQLAEAFAHRGNTTYQYLFDWPCPALGGKLGSCHIMDVGLVFGTYDDNKELVQFFGAGDEVEKLSSNMQDAWISFARTGVPSCAPIGEWTPYSTDLRCTTLLGSTIETVQAPMDDRRKLLAGANQGVVLGWM